METKILRPSQIGWLRRKELDQASLDIWEKPDGELYASPKGKTPEIKLLIDPDETTPKTPR